MKTQSLLSTAPVVLILFLQIPSLVHAHYGFPVLIVNETATKWFEFVRPVAPDELGGVMFPIYDYWGETQVCGINATHTGHLTKTAIVEAGSQLGMRAYGSYMKKDEDLDRPFKAGRDGMGHLGPGQIYMSKATGDIESYLGDGDWFKIAAFGWETSGKGEMNFTIPKTTPPGRYLVRAEHFNMNTVYNETQQFIGCAQVEVTGPGGGTPGPTIKFPGGYDVADPGIWLPNAMSMDRELRDRLYKGPGPAVWKG